MKLKTSVRFVWLWYMYSLTGPVQNLELACRHIVYLITTASIRRGFGFSPKTDISVPGLEGYWGWRPSRRQLRVNACRHVGKDKPVTYKAGRDVFFCHTNEDREGRWLLWGWVIGSTHPIQLPRSGKNLDQSCIPGRRPHEAIFGIMKTQHRVIRENQREEESKCREMDRLKV